MRKLLPIVFSAVSPLMAMLLRSFSSFIFLIPIFISLNVSSQISLNSSNFPLAGTEYNRFICVNANPGNAGAGQQYDFSSAMIWANDTLRYLSPSTTGFASSHPGSSVATVQPGEITMVWFYSSDSNAFWTSGGTLIGDFGNGMTVVHANHPAPYVDTLVSDEYVYGHSETEISGIRFQNLVPGVDYQTVSGKYIMVDGWGSLYAPLDTFADVLRVKYVEFKYDTVFSNNVPVDANADTLYYYKYFAEGIRQPVVIAYTDAADNVQWMEIIHFPDTLFGCTDTSAENFNPLASADNGSCVYCNQVNYTISPDTSVCAGDSISLVVTGGTDFLWSTGDSVSSITVAPDSSATFSVYLSNQSYCWDMASVNIDVTAEASAGFWPDLTNAADGDSILFVNTSSNASSYLWNFGDSSSSTQKNPKHIFDTEGIKTVTLIAYNPCSADTFILEFTILNKNEFAVPSFMAEIYPNPNNGIFSITMNPAVLQNPVSLRIYNSLGSEIFQSSAINPKSTLDFSSFPPGIYMLKIQSDYMMDVKRIVKQ